MSDIVTTMDQLPLEMLEMIFDKMLWDSPGELYRLRAVSHTWKSVAERSGSRVFQYWYNRCKAEIPEEHLQDIVQVKYPLVANPWQEFYWVNSRLPYVAKNVYNIWKNFPYVDNGIEYSKRRIHYPVGNCAGDAVFCMNDKYLAQSYNSGDTRMVIEIYRWDNLGKLIKQYSGFRSRRIDFYCTEKGTFVLLPRYNRTSEDFEIYISKFPIENNLDLSPEFVLLGHGKKYCITQNEWFFITEDPTTHSRIIEHKILTERGLETNAVIEPPLEISGVTSEQIRVEICGCTLYVIQKGTGSLSFAKYRISRNSDGKLSFTLEESRVLHCYNDPLYSYVSALFKFEIRSENLYLTDSAFTSAKFNPWLLSGSYHPGRNSLLAVHANYVFRVDQKSRTARIFRKDNLIESMEADDPGRLMIRAYMYIEYMEFDFPVRGDPPMNWIGVIYIGLKATILVQFENAVCLMTFY